jgi:hypothetical protein
MGNVLDNVSKDNTRFTIFESNQVLTADQLNDLFKYLNVQSRTTRTRAIGVGIICGLEIGVLENKHLVLSRGSAITTDGDLISLDFDQEFDQYQEFEDLNARYPHFLLDTSERLPLFELRNSQLADSIPGLELDSLEATTGTAFKDYVGILYLEDYDNDTDLCTGMDCDNKGITAEKEVKVLLVHVNSVSTLLQSMPAMNKDYFSLEDIHVPRVKVSTGIDTLDELNASFNDALSIKDEIKVKLSKAYQTCQALVEDLFDNTDPTTGWNTLLDQHFAPGASVTTQYVYDFARDISTAYNELRESLFSDDMLCCPDVNLFPKHVLLGLVRDASVKNPIVPVDVRDSSRPDITGIASSIAALLHPRLGMSKNIFFNPGASIKRFNRRHIDLQYRHHFYESPILNNNDEVNQFTRFCFMRLHSMITNFRVPSTEEVGSLNSGLKITPSYCEDAPLGERSIPFYYRPNPNLPLNLYWNFTANNRKKENQLLSYHSNTYSDPSSPSLNPLNFSILKYTFFRIEGHIGFKRADVEAALNQVVLENNLPINIQSVQVEKKLDTIPPKKWHFPHLYMYEKSLKSTFIDRLEDADSVNDELKAQEPVIPVTEFKTAKQTVLDNAKDIGDPQFNFMNYRSAITNVINATTNVKAQTRKYTFSNTAIPHDFILNADILRKTDVISGIYQDALVKKKKSLMLGNFMKENRGLEHNGGVIRGGTFVIVYTADDQRVVADFMLPYASIDKDVVPDPPVYTPPAPLPTGPPIVPRFPIEAVFEIKPNYVKEFEDKIGPYVKETDIDTKIQARLNPKIAEIETKFDLKLEITNTKVEGIAPQISSFDQRLKDNSQLFNSVLTKDAKSVVRPDGLLGTKDLTLELENFRKIQKTLDETPIDAPNRAEIEKNVIEAANVLTTKLNDPIITEDPSNSLAVKSILADVHTGTSLVRDSALKNEATSIAEKANTINRNLKINR